MLAQGDDKVRAARVRRSREVSHQALPRQRRFRQFTSVTVVLFGLYALSSGPAYWFFSNAWREKDWVVIYYPVWWFVTKNDGCLTACERYLDVCRPFASRIDILPPTAGDCWLPEGGK